MNNKENETNKRETKRCSTCNETKTLDKFTKNKSQKDGLSYTCKQCNKRKFDLKPKNNIYSGISGDKTKWERECPSCHSITKHKAYGSFYTSNKNNSNCIKCNGLKLKKGEQKTCLQCNKDIYVTPCQKNTKLFCSQKCSGLNKIFRNTIEKTCEYCSKIFRKHKHLIKWYEGKWKIGRFCSRRCLCKFNVEKNQREGTLNGTNSKPELLFKKMLDENSIEYTFQYVVDYEGGNTPYKVFDFYIPLSNTLIEIDGTYWHGKGLKINELNNTQRKNRINDRIKNKLAKDKNMKLIRIWTDEMSSFDFTHLKIKI